MNEVLAALQQAVVEATERVGPAVVGIGRGWGRGSGVVFAPGQVLTVAHVLRGDEVAVTIGGEVVEGRVLGADSDLNVALLAVDTGDVEPVAWADEGVEAGAPVFALANPGGRGLRATFGLVSATGRSFRGPRGRRIGGSLEHSAPLPRGSSGGPLVDAEHHLLGLNTIRIEGGLILAVPADAAMQRRAEALHSGAAKHRPRLGIAIAPPRAARRMRAAVGLPERDGLLVRGVEADGPAAKAGIERGDLLIGVGGQPLSTVDALFDALEGGGELTLQVLRGTEERTVSVPLQ